MINREDFGSWLEGPQQFIPKDSWPGKRLGLPESGRGSAAPVWRRFVALFIDWSLSYFIALLLTQGNEWAILATYSTLCLVALPTLGYTPGYWVMGILVMNSAGQKPSFAQIVLRHLLWALIIPGVVYNIDRRGLHDLAANTAVVKR